MSETLLDVRGLTVTFPTLEGDVHAVSDLSYTLERGETLGIVGESGSGKSVSSLALMGLLNRERTHIVGEALFRGRDLLSLKPEQMRDVRGKDIAMIFQDPFACLHPMHRVGDQIAEAVTAHAKVSGSEATARAVEMLNAVGIPRAKERARDYPHQFSGGMRQRAMIAMALVNNPAVLIADEPTTALDVTVQAQILELIERVKDEFDVGVILITHDRAARWRTGRRARCSRRLNTRIPGACCSRCPPSSGSSNASMRSRALPHQWSPSPQDVPSIRAARTGSPAASPSNTMSRAAVGRRKGSDQLSSSVSVRSRATVPKWR